MKPRKDEEWHRMFAGIPLDPVETLPRDALIEWLRFEVESEMFDRALPGFWFGKDRGLDVWMPHDRSLSSSEALCHVLHAETQTKAVGRLQALILGREGATEPAPTNQA